MTALRNASAQKAPLFPALTKCVGLMKFVAFRTTVVDATGVSQPLSHCLGCYEVLTNFIGHHWVKDSRNIECTEENHARDLALMFHWRNSVSF